MDRWGKLVVNEIAVDVPRQSSYPYPIGAGIVNFDLTKLPVYNVIDVIVKLYYTLTIPDENEVIGRRRVKSLFTILSREYGLDFIIHLHRYGAYTDYELKRTYDMSKQTAHNIRKRLISLELHQEGSYIHPKTMHPNPRRSGKAPAIWLGIGATDEQIDKARERYRALVPTYRTETKQTKALVQTILEYANDHDIKACNFDDLCRWFPGIQGIHLKEAMREIHIHHKESFKVWF